MVEGAEEPSRVVHGTRSSTTCTCMNFKQVDETVIIQVPKESLQKKDTGLHVVCVCVCVFVLACVSVCVCACMRECVFTKHCN